MAGKIISMKAWSVMACDGFVAVGHRGNIADEFETILLPIAGTDQQIKLEGRFNVIQAEGLKDALQIHELTGVLIP